MVQLICEIGGCICFFFFFNLITSLSGKINYACTELKGLIISAALKKAVNTALVCSPSFTSHAISCLHFFLFCIFFPLSARSHSELIHTHLESLVEEKKLTLVLQDKCSPRTGCSPAAAPMNINLRFKDTIILQGDLLQFGKVIDSLQVFYTVVISFQDLQV